MSYDLEHKLIYETVTGPVVVFGDKVIGENVVRIYLEEDGTFAVTSTTEASDMDPRDFNQIRLTKSMLAVIVAAKAPLDIPVVEGGWQPIETASKEHGKEILITCDCPHMMAVVEWLDAAKVMDDDFVSGWDISDGHNDPIWFRANPYMTHWQPLPALPLPSAAGSGEKK